MQYIENSIFFDNIENMFRYDTHRYVAVVLMLRSRYIYTWCTYVLILECKSEVVNRDVQCVTRGGSVEKLYAPLLLPGT